MYKMCMKSNFVMFNQYYLVQRVYLVFQIWIVSVYREDIRLMNKQTTL